MADDNAALLLQLSADVRGLEKQFARAQGIVDKGSSAMERRAQAASSNLEKFFGKADVGKALDHVFDATRFKVLDSGVARVGVFGSALETLGPAGLAAAAGIGAVALAAEQARKALDWAEDLQRTADKLGVTTKTLQEFDFAAAGTGVGIDQGRQALEQFNQKIGQFEAHIRDKTIEKFAAGMHLTRTETLQTTDTVEKLRLVLDHLATLGDAPERAAAAKSFGLEGLLPVINGGKAKIDEFIAKMKDAQGAGGVVGEDDIRKAAELKDKVNDLAIAIGNDLRTAFITLGPEIQKVAGFIKDCADKLAAFIGAIPAAIRGIEELANAGPKIPIPADISTPQPNNRLFNPKGDLFFDPLNRLLNAGPKFLNVPIPNAVGQSAGDQALTTSNILATGKAAILGDKVAALLSGPHPGLKPGDQDPTRPTPTQLNFDKPKPAKPDDTAQRTDQVNETLAQADKKLQEALKGLTDNIDARAAFERKALLDEQAVEAAKLQKQKDDLNKDKSAGLKAPADKSQLTALAAQVKADQNITIQQRDQLLSEIALAKTKRDQLKAALDVAGVTQQQATQAKIELVNRQADFALEDQLDETRKQLVDATIAQLEAAAAQATTAAERTKIERDILKLKQDEFAHELGKTLSRQVETGALSQPEADQRFAAGLSTLPAQTQQFDLAHQQPIQAYLRSLQDLNTQMQNAGVSAAHNLAAALADAIVNAHNLGDAAKGVFRQLLQDLLTNAIERDISAPLLRAGAGLFSVPGAAAGAATSAASAAPVAAAIATATASGAGEMGISISTAGTAAATAMASAIVAAGTEVSAALGSTLAAAGAAGGGGGGLFGAIFRGLGNFGGGGIDFAGALKNWGGSFALTGFAEGGRITGPGTGTSDSILAQVDAPGGGMIRVANGEFIVNAEATRKNLRLLQAINEGRDLRSKLPRFAEGGLVSTLAAPPRLPVVDAARGLEVPNTTAGGAIIIHQTQFELNSPVVTQDLLNQMRTITAEGNARLAKQINRGFPARSRALQDLGT